MSVQPTSDMLAAALEAEAAGLSVVPPVEDGSKRPQTRHFTIETLTAFLTPAIGAEKAEKVARSSLPDGAGDTWVHRQYIRATCDDVERIYRERRDGLGFACGRVSGNIEVLEFDDFTTYQAYKQAAVEAGIAELVKRVETGYSESTPGRGVHWPYRCETITGNTKLAQRPGPIDPETNKLTVETLIETRGEGGFVVTAPSYGSVHPSKRAYVRESGRFATIATITPGERETLWELARRFDQMPRRESPHNNAAKTVTAGGVRPGDDFNARANWAEVLEPAGWRHVHDRGSVSYWCRPGKNHGVSATTNYAGSDLFYSFTTSSELDAEHGYSKFAVYALLHHGGDFAAAAKGLVTQGYGERSRTNASPEHLAAERIAIVHALPSDACLTDVMLSAATNVRKVWLDPYMGVAHTLSPRTSRALHEDCAVFALCLTIARRVYVRAGPKKLYPALMILFVGRSTLSGKTTAFDVLRQIIEDAGLLDLLLPSSFTPQALLADLALHVPTNIREGTSQTQIQWLNKHRHGAQRAIIRDEAAGLLDDCQKDYNTGLLPLILKLDGAPDYVDSDLTISRGLTEVHNACTNFIGATTPSALRDHAAKSYHWANGLFGRFSLSDPDEEPHWAFWSRDDVSKDVNAVVSRLHRVYNSLPLPTAEYVYGPAKDSTALLPIIDARQLGYQAREANVDDDAWEAWSRYDRALFGLATRDDSSERLDPTYGRLASAAIRVALALAVADWALASDDHRMPIRVQIGHWAAAQQIAERWRVAAHTVLANALLSENVEGQTKQLTRLVKLLADKGGQMRRGDILRSLNWTTDGLTAVIAASGGRVVERKEKTTGGRPPEWVELVAIPPGGPEVAPMAARSNSDGQSAGIGHDGAFSAFSAFSPLVGPAENEREEAVETADRRHSTEPTKDQKALKALKERGFHDGDLVNCVNMAGDLVTDTPRRITSIDVHTDGSRWIRVEGTETWYPIDQVELVKTAGSGRSDDFEEGVIE